MKKILLFAILVCEAHFMFGQQWSGSPSTSGLIERTGDVAVGSNLTLKNQLSNLNYNNTGMMWIRSVNPANPNNNPNEVMSFTADGRIGIGMHAPGEYRLDVNGNMRASSLVVMDNLGIGTESVMTNYRLDVNGNIRNQGYHFTYANPSGVGVLNFGNGNPEGMLYVRSLNSTDFNDYNDIMTLRQDGKVGIGITNPQEKLHVDGSVRLSDQIIIGESYPTNYGVSANALPKIDIQFTPGAYGAGAAWYYDQPAIRLRTQNPTSEFAIGARRDHQFFIGAYDGGGMHHDGPNSLLIRMTKLTLEAPGGLFFSANNINLSENSFRIESNNFSIKQNGDVLIRDRMAIGMNNCTGNLNTDYRLYVNGNVRARRVEIDMNNWCDYVFEEDYTLKPLDEVEAYIKEHKHLEEIPSAKEVEEKGIDLGEMNALLLKKVEEITLYLIEMKKDHEQVKKDHEQVKQENELLKVRVHKLEKQ